MPKRKQEMQFRYYEMPEDSFVLSLTGQSWVRKYGDGIASLHFHNYLEIGVCYEGTGEMIYDEQVFSSSPAATRSSRRTIRIPQTRRPGPMDSGNIFSSTARAS